MGGTELKHLVLSEEKLDDSGAKCECRPQKPLICLTWGNWGL